MDGKTFTVLMQRYVANIAITGPTLRNQGAKGVTEGARKFLSNLDLAVLNTTATDGYAQWLDICTEALRRALPRGARNWGTARKAINVFMVQTFLNKHLAREYGLCRFGQVLETPLDALATQELRKLAGRGHLPRWDSIKDLTPEVSKRYQDFASQLAAQHGLPRACLDTMLWRVKD